MKKDDVKRTEQIAGHYAEILRLAGFDPIPDTPLRAAKAFLEMTKGHRTSIDDEMRLFEKECRRADEECSNMIILQGVRYVSLCEHHLLPFIGHTTVAYIPSKKILGLSKLTRIVEYFAHRLQSQERMAHDIAELMDALLKPRGIAVVIDGKHTCSSARGVEDHNSVFKMDVLQGLFLTDPMTRSEFFSRISQPVP